MVFSGFQDILISKDLFKSKNPHVSVAVTWFSEVLIELVVLYMVSILIFHVKGIDMLVMMLPVVPKYWARVQMSHSIQ